MVYFIDPRIKVHKEPWGAIIRGVDRLFLVESCHVSIIKDLKENSRELFPRDLTDAHKFLLDREIILTLSKGDIQKGNR